MPTCPSVCPVSQPLKAEDGRVSGVLSGSSLRLRLLGQALHRSPAAGAGNVRPRDPRSPRRNEQLPAGVARSPHRVPGLHSQQAHRLQQRDLFLAQWPARTLGHTFARFALPMVWDFCEVNPLSATTGGFRGMSDWVARYVDHALHAVAGLFHRPTWRPAAPSRTSQAIST